MQYSIPNHWLARVLALAGVLCVIAGLAFIAADRVAYAQDDSGEGTTAEATPEPAAASQGRPARYRGSDECSDCHRNHVRALGGTPHNLALTAGAGAAVADFDAGTDLRTVTLPGADAARPFTADDVAYVIGAGLGRQAFVTQTDSGLFVLPVLWDVAAAEWLSLPLAETWPAPEFDFVANCAGCHVTGLNVEDADWEEPGVQCEACHGPASDHLDAVDEGGRNPNDEELAAIRTSINPAIDPQVCGQCHAAGRSPNGTPFPVGYRPGQPLTDTFAPYPPDDTANWHPTGHASGTNMQYNEWLNTGHSRSLANLVETSQQSGFAVAPECLTCHAYDYGYTLRLIELVDDEERAGEPPADPTIDTMQYGVTCLSCHNAHQTTDRAVPYNLIDQPDALCATCHSNANFASLFPDGGRNANGIHNPVVEMWEGRAVVDEIAPEQNAHVVASDGPTCTTCHYPSVPVSNDDLRASHTLNPVMPGAVLNVDGLTDTCSACHEDAATPAALQQLIDDIQADTTARIEAARTAVTDTTPAWVTAALDFVDSDGSAGIHNYAYADALLDAVFVELNLYATDAPAVAVAGS